MRQTSPFPRYQPLLRMITHVWQISGHSSASTMHASSALRVKKQIWWLLPSTVPLNFNVNICSSNRHYSITLLLSALFDLEQSVNGTTRVVGTSSAPGAVIAERDIILAYISSTHAALMERHPLSWTTATLLNPLSRIRFSICSSSRYLSYNYASIHIAEYIDASSSSKSSRA